MKHVFIITFLFSSYLGFSQNEELVKQTLQKYTEGSSYNKLEMLESAFTENATLYLTGKDGFKRYTPKEYAAFFKNKKYGKFNGRSSKILAIEVVKDIATAKVEIVGPERKWVYIDLFLLKKLESGWKIISKTATRVDDAKIRRLFFLTYKKMLNFNGFLVLITYLMSKKIPPEIDGLAAMILPEIAPPYVRETPNFFVI